MLSDYQAHVNQLMRYTMKPIKQLIRLIHINTILARNGLDKVVVSIRAFCPVAIYRLFKSMELVS